MISSKRMNQTLEKTSLITVVLLTTILMMIFPMPAWMLDVGLALAFALAIAIFTIVLFCESPLDFSTFPTILLASLLLRLSLNISSTKLIIGQGHEGPHAAGSVIEAFAAFIMGGSLFQGIVIFLVLIIVNFMVITKGAGRMAEVGARFALDGMPGRQMAIDSDVSSGAISSTEAKLRREKELIETNFYGSLDGASKFVKGDAVAGLIITAINLLAGLGVGVISHGLPLAEALKTYSLLTVGDGLVTQIPAVITSVAAALLLSRNGSKAKADTAIAAQFLKYPQALANVAGFTLLFGFFPGMPFLPFAFVAAVLAGLSYYGFNTPVKDGTPEASETNPAQPTAAAIGDILELDEIHLEFSPDLVELILDPATGLDKRITSIRNFVAKRWGLILPEMRLTDDPTLGAGCYRIKIQGVEASIGFIERNAALTLIDDNADALPDGRDVAEPVYGALARWIPDDAREEAALEGLTLITPCEVLATHLLEVIKTHLSRLMTLKTLRKTLHELTNLSDPVRSEANRQLFADLIPDRVQHETLLSICKLLLGDQISVRKIPLILEALAEQRGIKYTIDELYEKVRGRLSPQIMAEIADDNGKVHLVQLSPEWEMEFTTHEVKSDLYIKEVLLPPDLYTQLINNLRRTLSETGDLGSTLALVVVQHRRRYVQYVLRSKGIGMAVVSYDEVGDYKNISLHGTVGA